VVRPKAHWIKLIVIAVFGLIMFMTFVKGMYRAEGHMLAGVNSAAGGARPVRRQLDKIYKKFGDVVKEGTYWLRYRPMSWKTIWTGYHEKERFAVELDQANGRVRNDEPSWLRPKKARAQIEEKAG